ncbi:hypothetical protein A3860_36890 [Niastella vici]|uniref:Carbohydrate-binding protein SusD n=1 Tax=Niastella vici TaxID=1703345 RepID=A0A1V9FMK5_9BACT|nr:RagB/SusD family nutrient uptake outer membrane protein [Niastella vici]OQP59570.1 hypothetical protein A3860_36890 [Niastella vici]
MKAFNLLQLLIIINFLVFTACNKNKLRENTDTSLLIINTVDNAQALLDNTNTMRETPGLSELSADDYFLTDTSAANNKVELNTYFWKPDIFEGQTLYGDWYYPYQQVYIANSILEAMPKLANSGNQSDRDRIAGSARFIRAYALFNVVLEFAKLYSPQAGTDLGIPVRLSPDPAIPSSRATVKATYDQVIDDCKQSLPLLPGTIDNKRKNRPCLAAGYALLARVYLVMADYTNARLYADSCLQLHNKLIDYNGVSTTDPFPFNNSNEEVIYQSNLLSTINLFNQDNFVVDSTLYKSYDSHDLRKQLFYTKNNDSLPVLKPGYSGTIFRFSGLATDEMLLIRAEANARLQNTSDALNDLNALLEKRWSGTYTPLTASSPAAALELVLAERRRELVFRGLRWADIRRYNRENQGISLKRVMNGKEYTLPANSNLFVLPIPPDVISSVQGLQQNPR